MVEGRRFPYFTYVPVLLLLYPTAGVSSAVANAALTRGPRLAGAKAMQARDIAVQWLG